MVKITQKFDSKNPDYMSIIIDRNDKLLQLQKAPQLFKAAHIHYETNPIDFINDWMWTFDPRRKDLTLVPFITFPRQNAFIQWLQERVEGQEDGLTEKSRDMGVTYLCCAYSVWAWLFKGDYKISFGSRKEKLVDNLGDSDSILEKIRMIIRGLPTIFMPTYKDNKGQFKMYAEAKDAQFMKIINRANGSSITGEAGDNIGRGGRSSIYFKDESAFYERPEKIDAALSMNSDVKIDISTINLGALGAPFHMKRFSGTIPVFTFKWDTDPRKDQAWYDEQTEKYKYSPETVAQEIDINWAGTGEGICIPPKWVEACVDSHIKLGFEPSGMKKAGLDVADEGGDSNALSTGQGCVITDIDEWKEGDTTQTSRRAYAACEEKAVEVLNYDSIGVGAGVKGETNEIKKNKSNPIDVNGVNVGSTDLPGYWRPGKKNKDMFLNVKAKGWWSLRVRAQKTYENLVCGADHPHDELLSIPNNATLKMEMSQPKIEYAENGKVRIESKQKLLKRGIKSHNIVDSILLYFAENTTKEAGTW